MSDRGCGIIVQHRGTCTCKCEIDQYVNNFEKTSTQKDKVKITDKQKDGHFMYNII